MSEMISGRCSLSTLEKRSLLEVGANLGDIYLEVEILSEKELYSLATRTIRVVVIVPLEVVNWSGEALSLLASFSGVGLLRCDLDALEHLFLKGITLTTQARTDLAALTKDDRILSRLCLDSEVSVRMEAASRVKDLSLLEVLSRDTDELVRWMVAVNPSCTNSLLSRLAFDTSPLVKDAARHYLRGRLYGLQDKYVEE